MRVGCALAYETTAPTPLLLILKPHLGLRQLILEERLVFGDGLPTDIRGANARGLDVLFVANGIHGAETVGPDGLIMPVVSDLLHQDGLHATWAIADLVW